MRKITQPELDLIKYLLESSDFVPDPGWESRLMVAEMNDSGMGSLLIYPDGEVSGIREFGSTISECQFKDADGIDVLASLNIDDAGKLFELDIWKTDFSRLIKFPERFRS